MKDFTTIHPRHMEEHIRSLSRMNHLAARETVLLYLEQIYTKFLAENKTDHNSFDNEVLSVLRELQKKWKS